MREVRLRFAKTGRLKYISHLDINRAMSRAFKRAGIPLWYTEGFNPHPYMNFSLPLSLGVESLCESVDIRLVDEISNNEIKAKMNEVLPADLKIIDVYDDFRQSGEIVYSDYVFKFQFNDNEIAVEKITDYINNQLDNFNTTGCHPYRLELSMGCAEVKSYDMDGVLMAFKEADDRMYEQKRKHKEKSQRE